MKHLKAKLLATVMSLTLSMLMLTSASFAWFTISTAPEITDLSTSVVTNENLEICLARGTAVPGAAAVGDTGNAYTWGNVVGLKYDANDQTGSNYTSFYNGGNTQLRPITTADITGETTLKSFKYPQYGRDGRVDALASMNTETNFTVTDSDNNTVQTGFGVLKDAADGQVYAYYVDFWLRSNVSGTVSLASPTDAMKLGDSNSRTGDGTVFKASARPDDSAMAQNLRIAFRELGREDNGVFTAAGAALGVAGMATPATSTFTAATAAVGDTPAQPAKNVFSGDVVTLTANQGRLIRMFVYLDGQNVTNAAASTDAHQVGGTLSVQFKMAASGTEGQPGYNDGISAGEAMQAIPAAPVNP